MLETDGPMLEHGLQGLNGLSIEIPVSRVLRPDRELLERRHRQFMALAETRLWRQLVRSRQLCNQSSRSGHLNAHRYGPLQRQLEYVTS